MPRKDKLLTDRAIKAAKPGAVLNDGNGLTLRVGKRAASWVLRYTLDGKAANLGLGSYPHVSLKEARALATDRRSEIAEGVKPVAIRTASNSAKRTTKPTPVKPAAPTFRVVSERCIALHQPTWSGPRQAAQWRSMIDTYANPIIGDIPINEIAASDVTAVLEPIWLSKRETSTRLKQRLATVFDYAVGHGLRSDNPVPRKMAALPRRKRQRDHFAALDYHDVPAAIATIRGSGAKPMTRLALEFLTLTAARAGEVRGMTWEEVDIINATWAVPADRMKMRRCHRVPLSVRALEILEEARELTGGVGLVFPAKSGKMLSDMVFTQLLRRLDIPCVAHGFRSSFRDWGLAETQYPWAVGEAALSHNLGNALESAYARTDLFERRQEMMQEWTDFIYS